jgi:arylsulfatase A-like enzyme
MIRFAHGVRSRGIAASWRGLVTAAAGVLALLGAGVTDAAAQQPASRPPNILFILADDLGYGDLGCYGQKTIRTPQIDRLAAEGTRFTQCYAGSTVCAPSRCCLMTGLHTGHARVRGNALVPLKPEDLTVAELLKTRGYTTALVGKWGLGEPGTTGVPNKQGFDEFFGFLNQHHAHNYYPEFLWKNQEKYRLEGNVEKDNVATKAVTYAPDLFAREAIGFLERNKDRPFFLYYSPTLPHANNERGRAEGNGMEVPSDAPYSDRDWPQPQKNHAAMITRLDGDVGRVLARLKDLGLEGNTIVFFSSDNGPHKEGGADPKFFKSSGPLRGYKRAMYDGGIRVPMIVRWPGHVPSGAVSDQPWAFWDFLPTAAALTGAQAPAGLDGVSVVPALLGKGAIARRDPLYWEFHERGTQQSVRMGDWKAVRLGMKKPLELYDLKHDPGESHDVAASHPDIVAKIESYLRGARTDSPDFPVR